MKKLRVKLTEIADYMETDTDSFLDPAHFYLDIETGETLLVPEGVGSDDDNADDDDDDDEDERVAKTDFGKEEAALRRKIDADPDRYEKIPHISSRDGYRDMVDFARTVTDKHMVELLDLALDGKGAFGRFKNVLHRHPAELERWHKFKADRMKKRVIEWLEELNIEPVEVD